MSYGWETGDWAYLEMGEEIRRSRVKKGVDGVLRVDGMMRLPRVRSPRRDAGCCALEDIVSLDYRLEASHPNGQCVLVR